MYEIVNGCIGSDFPKYFPGVFLFGEEGIPLQENRVVNRFVNFADDQLLIWLMMHQNRQLTKIDGTALPLYGDWAENFWHWCYEALPVALAAHQAGFIGTYLVPDIPFAATALKLLGIQPDRIRCADGGDYYLECMCLPGKRRGSDPANQELQAKIRSILRSRFARPGSRHRIYISRNGNPGNSRKIVNEAELLQILTRYGFITLRMEDLSLEEQLSYTCNCNALVAPHGAGVSHCAFFEESSLLLELFPPNYVNPCVIPVCHRLRHRYFQITSASVGDYQHGRDIMADLRLIEMTLARELG